MYNVSLTERQLADLINRIAETVGRSDESFGNFKPEWIGFFDPPQFFAESEDMRREGSRTIFMDVFTFKNSIEAYQKANPKSTKRLIHGLHLCFMGEALQWFTSEVPDHAKHRLWNQLTAEEALQEWYTLLVKRWGIPSTMADARLAALQYSAEDALALKDISAFATKVFRYARHANENQSKWLRILFNKLDPRLTVGMQEPMGDESVSEYVEKL